MGHTIIVQENKAIGRCFLVSQVFCAIIVKLRLCGEVTAFTLWFEFNVLLAANRQFIHVLQVYEWFFCVCACGWECLCLSTFIMHLYVWTLNFLYFLLYPVYSCFFSQSLWPIFHLKLKTYRRAQKLLFKICFNKDSKIRGLNLIFQPRF